MNARLDIFRVEQDGSVLWKGTAENLENAKLSALVEMHPADYIIADPRVGTKTLIRGDALIGPKVAA